MDSAPGQLGQVGARRALGLLALLVVVFTAVWTACSPAPASAFIGESLVVDGAGKLTSPAQTILKNPTFLTENIGEAAVLGGPQEASAAAGVFEAGTLLPALGSVLSFGVGTVIGSEICKVIGIEGCWYFGSDGADPVIGGKGSWVYSSGGISGGPTGSFYWSQEGSPIGTYIFQGLGGVPAGCSGAFPSPSSMTGAALGSFNAKLVSCSGTVYPGNFTAPYRYGMSNRHFDYHAKDEPGISNYSHSANGEWPQKFGNAIKGHSGDAAGRVGQKIASEIDGSIHDPYKTYVEVPSCAGMTGPECLVELEELDLKPKITELDWDDAVIEELDELEPEKTREEESERVIELVPAAPSEVVIGTDVEVVTNPEEKDMPKWVPLPPPDGEDEDAEEYKKKRRLIPPLWLPSVDELDDGQLDPDKGPGAVVTTTPKPNFDSDPGGEPDGRLDPHTETEIRVWTNPETAPEPGSYGTGAPGGFTPPTVPAVDMDPLAGLSPCGVFPFGLFCWVGEAFAQFNTSGTCPNFSAPVADTGSNFAVTLCGETAETIMGYLRPAILLAFTVGLGFLFARGTKAIGSD